MTAKTFTPQIKMRIATKSNYCCTCCGYPDFAMLEYDHITPRSKGGEHTLENGQLLCHACNQKKGENTVEFTPRLPAESFKDCMTGRQVAWKSQGWKLEEQLEKTVRRKRKIYRS